MALTAAVASTILLHLLLANFAFGGLQGQSVANDTAKKQGKLFSLFQVVRFSNVACSGSTGKNGTCYISSECTAKAGVNAGSCAAGYGVCCVFSLNCGASTSQNCSYFESTGSEVGSCTLNVCKTNSDICQLRLDLNTFVISGPSTLSTSITTMVQGQPAVAVAKGVAWTSASACTTDVFTITNPGGSAPPTICGSNSGSHIYVDASSLCNELGFQLGTAAGLGSSLVNRQWSIKITQYSCEYPNLAPPGCTQYFFGATSNCVTSFNFAGGQHLANQNQNICVRICWTATAATDVQLNAATIASAVKPTVCCGYGSGPSLQGAKGFDCLTLAGAEKLTGILLTNDRVCGKSVGLDALTICSNSLPFSLRFLSDMYETMPEGSQKGFRVCFSEDAVNC